MLSNLEKWNFVLRDLPSPQLFIDYTWYWTISSALQRRVFFGEYDAPTDPLFANAYMMFVSEPSVGKSRAARISGARILKTFRYIDPAKIAANIPLEKAWSDSITFSADDTTIESLIQQLNRSTKTITIPHSINGVVISKPVQHASMSILLSEEMASLFKSGNEGVAPFLNQCYDAQDYVRQTKTRGDDIIRNVCISFLGCTTPDSVRGLMKGGVLQQGFTSRVYPIFCETPRFNGSAEIEYDKEQKDIFDQLRQHIKNLLTVRGQVKFTPEATAWFDHYLMGDDPKNMSIRTPLQLSRINFDKRCDHFYGRLKVHIIKMAMILYFSDVITHIDDITKASTCSMYIGLDILKKAIAELQRIEPEMHKALASTGMNPLFDFYKKVHDAIKERGRLNIVQLKLLFGEDLDDLKLEAVIKHLGEVEKFEVNY